MYTTIKAFKESNNNDSFEEWYDHYIRPAKRSVQRALSAIWNRVMSLDKTLKKSKVPQQDMIRINEELMNIVKNLHTIDLSVIKYYDDPTIQENIKLPSNCQIGDSVSANFGTSGQLLQCVIEEIHFDEAKVYYDLKLMIDESNYTIIEHIDSAMIQTN